MKKKVNNSTDANNGEVPKQKERHIVSWSQEEDDILREQIRLHGTENWAIIASKFKDKTTRQCRRRWFTYLNSDFKRGGWSPEEDMLLCEAQKIFGNRWTEIAKVVSGRTDNAVKNRFTTLCKKRAKREALAKENNTISYINLNNKRVVFPNGLNIGVGSESAPPLKKIREPDLYESSPASSEYSTGSTQLSNVPSDKSEECQAEICVPHQENGLQSDQLDNQKGLAEEHEMCHTANTENEGKALPHENTRNGVNFPKPNHQSFPASTVQEVPPPLSVTSLMPVQNLQPSGVFVKCRAFFILFGVLLSLDCSNLDLSFSRIGLRRSAFESRVLWSILLLLNIDHYHLHP
ncbi:UNVERIFIED_CONTAM: Transcription factor [Sesamum radiatum]|uniref:Transcription factor n=1 Tax=Sesamum radiatum TaxID=300843 RepID=A0AAW2RZX8_SESRA